MKLFLDFLNVKTWDCETLLALFKKHNYYFSVAGQKRGYETSFFIEHPQYKKNCFFFEDDDQFAMESAAVGNGILPGDDRYQDAFKWLSELQKEWAATLAFTTENGPNIDYLNFIAERTRITYRRGKRLFDIEPLAVRPDDVFTIEQYLEFDYLHTFLTGRGNDFQRLRKCRAADCRKWFSPIRKTKEFCSDKCRLDFHNAIYAADGRAAASMRRSRLIGKGQ
ncbi:MAG: hypothetical protein WA081_06005 [Desulfosalsimonadaceae bacterium]